MARKLAMVLMLCAAALAANTSILNSFNAGEMTPLLEGRTDIDKYYSGCKTLENMLVFSQGGATRRPGTKFIAAAPEEINYPVEFYFGYYPASVSASISKYGTNNEIDTTWATSGNWPFLYGTWSFHCMGHTSDGGMIVGHGDYTDDNIPT